MTLEWRSSSPLERQTRRAGTRAGRSGTTFLLNTAEPELFQLKGVAASQAFRLAYQSLQIGLR
jgi:hypothetical protein